MGLIKEILRSIAGSGTPSNRSFAAQRPSRITSIIAEPDFGVVTARFTSMRGTLAYERSVRGAATARVRVDVVSLDAGRGSTRAVGRLTFEWY